MFLEWLITGVGGIAGTLVGIVILGAIITSMGALGDESLWGPKLDASLWRHIQVYFTVGILSAAIFAVLGGVGWGVWKGLHLAGYSGEWTITVAALITVPVVLIAVYLGLSRYYDRQAARAEQNQGEP